MNWFVGPGTGYYWSPIFTPPRKTINQKSNNRKSHQATLHNFRTPPDFPFQRNRWNFITCWIFDTLIWNLKFLLEFLSKKEKEKFETVFRAIFSSFHPVSFEFYFIGNLRIFGRKQWDQHRNYTIYSNRWYQTVHQSVSTNAGAFVPSIKAL